MKTMWKQLIRELNGIRREIKEVSERLDKAFIPCDSGELYQEANAAMKDYSGNGEPL